MLARGGRAVSRGWPITVTIFAVIVALNVGSRILNSLTGGSPGGPTSSSYATGTDGLAGYLSLLVAEGHPVDRLRVYPAKSALAERTARPSSSIRASSMPPTHSRSERYFVDHGGRLIIGGAEPSGWLQATCSHPRRNGRPQGVANAHVLAPVPELAGDTRLRERERRLVEHDRQPLCPCTAARRAAWSPSPRSAAAA